MADFFKAMVDLLREAHEAGWDACASTTEGKEAPDFDE